MWADMNNKEIIPKTFVPCTICDSSDYEHVCNSRAGRITFLKTPISICKNCGFVFVNPRWTQEQYDKVMDLWYPYKFTWDPPNDQNEGKRHIKWRKMDERISPYYPNGIKNLLDIGAGQGWCIEYMKRKYPDLKAFAIERWEACQKHIEDEYGGVIVGNEILGDWSLQHEKSFDLIVFRHTLEHILEPKKALEKVRRFLSEDGYAYIVVPSMRETTRLLTHDYFRPCHVSYFCKDSLDSLARQVGLEAVVLQEKGERELWGLFRRSKKQTIKPDLYKEMKEHISNIQKKESIKSMKFLLKIKLLNIIQTLKICKPISKQ